MVLSAGAFLLMFAIQTSFATQPAARGTSAPILRTVKHHGQRKHHKRKAHRLRRTDGPVCAEWGISLPCRCPQGTSPTVSAPPQNLPAGDGWVEVVLAYPSRENPNSCPGGIAVESENGTVVTSAGYSAAAHHEPTNYKGPGVVSNSVTTFVLTPGTWKIVADNQRKGAITEVADVVAGRGTKVTINLS